MNISSQDENKFLNRLAQIVESNLENENFGVNELAAKTGLSRSQIHRKLKSCCNKSVSQFIREIRLEKAKELLEDESLTSSEIAYKVGFGSPSYFIKSFHDYFGYPPGEYIKYSPENSGKEEITALVIKNNDTHKPVKLKSGKSIKLIFPLLFFISAIVIIYFSVQNRNQKEPVERSIAILPIKYIEGNQDDQTLADGIMEEILDRLCELSGLTVKSRNSSEIYRNSIKSTQQIAKELGASYILTGNILKEGKITRIYIQLVDAKNDVNIWSDIYEKDLHGILTFASEIAKKVAEHLQVTLSSVEIRRLTEVYNVDTATYVLYLKAEYFYKRNNLNSSIKYYHQVLELDSTFGLAWEGLARSYYRMTNLKFYPWDEGFSKAKKYAGRALEINPDLSKAHLVLAKVYGINWNWRKEENELRKAIEINPNYAEALMTYSAYLYLMDRREEARICLNKAIKLEPTLTSVYIYSTNQYYNDGNFSNALLESGKVLELDSTYNKWIYTERFKIFYHLGDYDKAIQEYLRFQKLDSPNQDYSSKLKKVYSKNGIKSVIQWIIENRKVPPDQIYVSDSINHFLVARYYGMLGNRDSALTHLELEYQQGHTVNLPRIKYDYDLQFLHGNPRFNALLKKMNLSID